MCAGMSRKTFTTSVTYDRFLRYVCDTCADQFDNTQALCEIKAALKQQEDIVGDAMLNFKRLQERMDLRDNHIDEFSLSLSATTQCECVNRIDAMERRLTRLIHSIRQDLTTIVPETMTSPQRSDSVSKEFIETTLSRHLETAEHVFASTLDTRAAEINSMVGRSQVAFMGVVDQAAVYLSTRLDAIEERISSFSPRFTLEMHDEHLSSATILETPSEPPHSSTVHEIVSLGDEIVHSDPEFVLPGPQSTTVVSPEPVSRVNEELYMVNAMALLSALFDHDIDSLLKPESDKASLDLASVATPENRGKPRKKQRKRKSKAIQSTGTPAQLQVSRSANINVDVDISCNSREQDFRRKMTKQQMQNSPRQSTSAHPPRKTPHKSCQSHVWTRTSPLSQSNKTSMKGGHSAIRWQFEQETHEKFSQMFNQTMRNRAPTPKDPTLDQTCWTRRHR